MLYRCRINKYDLVNKHKHVFDVGETMVVLTVPAKACNFPILKELPHRSCCYEELYKMIHHNSISCCITHFNIAKMQKLQREKKKKSLEIHTKSSSVLVSQDQVIEIHSVCDKEYSCKIIKKKNIFSIIDSKTIHFIHIC